ncbi:MAG: PAS domain S-box protein, partial [Nitrospirales bacterium]|nr:PAS domain S-box protein [Nitrospirales bacterium]
LGSRQWDIPSLRRLLEAILPRNDRVDNYEVEHTFPTLGHKTMLLNARHIHRGETGTPMILLAIEDITERKEAENAQRKSEERFRKVFETSRDGLLLLDNQTGRIVNVNPAIVDLLGYSREELIGKEFQSVGIVKDRDFQEILPELIDGGYIHYSDVRIETKTGRNIDTEICLVDRERVIQCNVRDMTKLKRAEERILESEERYRSVFDQAKDVVFTLRPDGTFSSLSPSSENVMGWQPSDLIGRPFSDIVHHDDLPGTFEVFIKTLAGESIPLFTVRILRKSGEYCEAEVSIALLKYGGTTEVLGLGRDITERKQIEEAFRVASAYNRSLIEASLDPLLTISAEGKITDVNTATEEVTGYPREELIGADFSAYFTEPEKAREGYRSVFSSGEIKDYPLEIRHRDGGATPVLYNASLFRDEAGGVLGVFAAARDISERKQLEAQLRQSQKMEAVGQLAGGIAHDFNNIITAIMGYCSVLQLKMRPDDASKILVDKIIASAERAANLTLQLLAFSRKQVLHPRLMNLNDSIRDIETLLLRLLGDDIELRLKLSDENLMVMMDPGQIGQVLLNLATNARDAMPNGGSISIETSVNSPSNHVAEPGRYALLTVTDSGQGMDERTRENIFEPFFTTKEMGKGTGLGLSIVYGIIREHNGQINVYSETGKGTTFEICFPLLQAGAEEAGAAGLAGPGGGKETILIAEDDTNVRGILKDVLVGYGYSIIEVLDGEDAVRVFRENCPGIDLVVLDAVMLKKGGREVYEEMRRTDPDIKVLFIIGYTDDVIHKQGISERHMDFISKPVFPREFLRRGREILNREPKSRSK